MYKRQATADATELQAGLAQAIATSAFTCTRPGGDPPDAEELEAFVAQHLSLIHISRHRRRAWARSAMPRSPDAALAEQGRGHFLVELVRYELGLRDGVVERDPDDLTGLKGDHRAQAAVMHGVYGCDPETSGQDAVKSGGGAAPLDVACLLYTSRCV